MILTVTPNTALDITYRVRSLRPHTAHRVTEVTERPGGKGLNVARVLAALGHEVTVTGFTGGVTGRALRDQLADTPGVVDALIPVEGATRRTIAVVDTTTGDSTQLNEPGPEITPAEWAAFQEAYEVLLRSASAVALCGSLPPGVPVGAYAGLIRTARAAAVPVLLDTSGEPLRRGIAARPDIVKPNADELAELTGSHEPLQATRDARRRGAHAVVASLGAQGLVAHTRTASGAPPHHAASTATRPARVTPRSRACCPAWWNTFPGPTAWPGPSPSPRRPYWPPWRASSTARRTTPCSTRSRSRRTPRRPDSRRPQRPATS